MDEKTKQKQDEIIKMVSSFCQDYLNDEYNDLAIKLVEKMGRKHDIPFRRGRLDIWASAVIYSLAQVNFLFDKSFEPYVSADDICDYFGTKKSTVSQKASKISDMFNLGPFDREFSTKDLLNNAPTFVMDNQGFIRQVDEMDLFFNEIYQLFSAGHFDEALDKLNTIEEDNPEYGHALFYKSIIYAALGEEEGAHDLFNEAIISEVSNTFNMSKDELRDDESFKRMLSEMEGIKNSSDAFKSGLKCYNDGDFESALDFFDLSLELDPNDSEVIYYKALALGNLEDFEIALDLIDKAIELDCEDDRFWNDKANFLTRLGNFKEAERCFTKAIKLNPNDSVLWANKGFMHYQIDQYEKALECYDKACKLEENVHNYVAMSNVYVDINDLVNAEECLKKAGEIDGEDIEYLTAMGHLMMYLEELDESLRYWDKILKIDSNQAEIWLFKGIVYLMKGNEDDAIECIDNAAEIDPMSILAFEELLEDD